MSEKIKMLMGEWYDATAEELIELRNEAKELTYEYNLLRPRESKKRKKILSQLLGGEVNNIHIEPPFYCDYGFNLKVGEEFFSNFNFVILDEAPIVIGDRVLIGPNVSIYTAQHPIDDIELRNKGIEASAPVSIGDDVWIGGSVTILPGVTIGDRVTIGAGSIVTSDIPSDSIAVGNPCKVVRERKR